MESHSAASIDLGRMRPHTTESTEGPHLKSFWNYNTKETAGKEITDIALHPTANNAFAVAYGTTCLGKEKEPGLVCVWNAKNCRIPERVYNLKSPATTCGFSNFMPYILAVGTLDGNIVLFDIRSAEPTALVSTFMQEDKHTGPIWKIYWLVQEDTTYETTASEALLTLGDDGYLKRWTITKGLESMDMMKTMRSTLQVPGRREKRNESLTTTLSTPHSVCFYPNDAEKFLIGTEEGWIHKCSTEYKDQYVATYVGHTGPVFQICFSPFDDKVFASCGGDWTTRLWNISRPAAALLVLSTGYRAVHDLAFSPFSSTVLITCEDQHTEVWDLGINAVEPMIRLSLPNDAGVRKVVFNKQLNSIIIGDDDGVIRLFGLRRFPKPLTDLEEQKDELWESLVPGYKARKLLKMKHASKMGLKEQGSGPSTLSSEKGKKTSPLEAGRAKTDK